MENKLCEWCQETEVQKSHHRFCSQTCKNRYISSKNNYKEIATKVIQTWLEKNPTMSSDRTRNCIQCNKEFVAERKEQKFCSHTCSAICSNSNRDPEVYKRQSEILKAAYKEGRIKMPYPKGYKKENTELVEKTCPQCNKIFFRKRLRSLKQKFCSVQCGVDSRKVDWKESLKNYRMACKFEFNLADYPDEFDFDLVREHGWYSPKNKKNNLGGVSRDHIFSVKDGYINLIDPSIMSHPANCQLMRHNDNVSKYKKSSITLNELLDKINIWNSKYNK